MLICIRGLISHINGLKRHLQGCFPFVLQAIFLFWNLAPFLHLWPCKLSPFHKRAARLVWIILFQLNF